MKYIFLLLFVLVSSEVFGQGHIDHIKQQKYLELRGAVDCNNPPGDNLSDRICANLAYQKSDSMLCVIYDSLISVAQDHHIDSLKEKIVSMQETWRLLRDKHCEIIYSEYEGGASGHLQAIALLRCLKEMTDELAN